MRHDFGGRVGKVDITSVTVPVLVVQGSDADKIGAIKLQEFAGEQGSAIIIVGPSDFHSGKIYGMVSADA